MGYRGRTKQLVILLILLCTGTATAQRFALDSRTYFDYGNQLTVLTRQLPDADSLQVYVNTANALFSFLKSDKSLVSRGAYFAVRDIAIELRDASGDALTAQNIHDTIFAPIFAQTTSKEAWNSKVITISLASIKKPQTIEVHTEVRDAFLARLSDRPNTESIELRSFSPIRSITGSDSTFIGIGDPILFDFDIPNHPYTSRNWGNVTEFSHDLTGAIGLVNPSGAVIDSVRLVLTQRADIYHRKDFKPVMVSSQLILSQDIFNNKALSISSIDSVIMYSLEDKKDTAVQHRVLLFKFSGESLEVGDYDLSARVYSGGESRTVTQSLSFEWHDMPLSLENPRDALPPMQYITTEDEYSNLSSGSKDQQLRNLYDYWKKQDPTPKTAYNERLAEFYHRADFAYFNFARNPRQLDGAMTDRGKVYILFGAPTNIQRSFLLGEQPVEIWTYANNVKKIFRFVDPSSRGDYKLVDVKPM